MGKNYANSRKTHRKQLIMMTAKMLHMLLSVLFFYIFWILFRYGELFPEKDVGGRYNYIVVIGYSAIILALNRTYNSYLLGYSRIRELVFSQILSQFFSLIIIYVAATVGWNRLYSPIWLLFLILSDMILDVIWAYCLTGLYFKLFSPKKTILIYRNKLDKLRFGSIKGKPCERMYKITEELMYNGNFKGLKDKLEGYDAIFVAGVNSRCRNGILKYCKTNAIPGFFLPHVGDVIMQESRHIQSFDSPVLFVTKTVAKPEYLFIKRTFDILFSLLWLIILSPVMVITAIAIKVYDRGPVIYKQVRLTKDGKTFNIWKFRSMRVDAEKDGVARLSTGKEDPRITPVGKFIRMCRLDELPQLFNIIRGDMSIVGPRPERPEIAEKYYKSFPDFRLRLQVKAGLTGYAQVYGKYNTSPYEKLEFDLLYINSMNILTDLKLMFATVRILFISESTEGISSDRTTAMDKE